MAKKLLPLFIFIFAYSVAVFSQSLVLTPSDTLSIDTTMALGQEAVMTYNIKNVTASDSVFEWRVFYNTLPHSWTIGFCDPRLCRTNFPGTYSYTLDANNTSTMQLDIDTATTACGIFQVVTWATGDSANTSTKVTYKVCVSTPNGIKGIEAPQISLYPNPVRSDLTVSLSQNLDNGRVEIFNLLGSRVYSQSINRGETIKELDLSTLETGLYIARISDGGTVIATKKFTKD